MTTAGLNIGITGYANAGGSGVVAGELGRQLARRGHTIHFIADAPPFRFAHFAEHVQYHEVAVPDCPPLKHPPYTLALAARMAEVSRQFALDILHVHYALPHAAAGILAQSILDRPQRPKLVTTLHGTDVTRIGSAASLYEVTSFCLRASNAVTAVSHSLQRAALDRFPDGARIEVIPNFVDLETFAPARSPGARARDAGDDVLLAHVSSFRSVKRPADAVRVLAAVNATRPARLILIGDGPEMPAVVREVEQLGLRDRVQMLGQRLDVQEILSGCDVFLLPSAEESFGLAALEAMACGVPAVTSDVGGLAELIENGNGGYRVASGDIAAMAGRVLDIVADCDTLELQRTEARRRAARFDAQLIVPMYEDLYMRTLT
ncbi:MAG TPA: N-acetyl-alpha-D-glucosaminyl L-malate synthase BshA [Steroidobacteraceae bacterium]|nr:N-acetyl-alpha-D-glucosaminyl L-malate synthase BshA [Steroidobacteraceae bacterium]